MAVRTGFWSRDTCFVYKLLFLWLLTKSICHILLYLPSLCSSKHGLDIVLLQGQGFCTVCFSFFWLWKKNTINCCEVLSQYRLAQYNLIWFEYWNLIGWSAWRKVWLYLITWVGIVTSPTYSFANDKFK